MSKILTQDEIVRSVSQMVIEHFGSVENFSRAFNKLVEREEKEFEERIEEYDKQHGSFFDRGSADSYYGRPRDPHRGGVGGFSGPRVKAETPEEFEAYHAGYDYNELSGSKKDWS